MLPGLALYIIHLLQHNCMDGHLAHDPVPYSTILDFSWWSLFSISLLSSLFLNAPKYGFDAAFLITILLSEVLIITAPLLLVVYYIFIRKEKTPNKALEPTIMAVTDCAPGSTLRASHDRGSV
jgi:hypothetical protein